MDYRFWIEEAGLQLNEIEFRNAVPIDGYGPNFFRVGGTPHKAPLVVTPKGVFSWGGYNEIDILLELLDQIDVLFIGTGEEIAHIPEEFRANLENTGVGVEVMSTRAAIRSYLIMQSDQRSVITALIL